MFLQKAVPGTGTSDQSFPRVDNIYNKLNNNYNNIINKQIITSSNNIDCTDLESEQQKILATKLNKEKDYKIIDKLKTIWLEEVGAFNDVGKSKYIAKQLLFTYNNHFESKHLSIPYLLQNYKFL